MQFTDYFFPERGKRHYTLSKDSLTITGCCMKVTLQLKELEADYRTVHYRSDGFYVGVIGIVLAVVLVLATKAGVPVTDFIESPIAAAVIAAIISLLVLFFTRERVEFAIFKSTMGLDAFSIARAGSDGSNFDHFVDELSRRIRQLKEAGGA